MLSAELSASCCCSGRHWQPWGFCPGQGGQCWLTATASSQHQPAHMLLSPFGEAAQCFWTQCRICPSSETQSALPACREGHGLNVQPPGSSPALPGIFPLLVLQALPLCRDKRFNATSLPPHLPVKVAGVHPGAAPSHPAPCEKEHVRRSMHEESPTLTRQSLLASKTHLELLAASSARHLAGLVSGCSVPPGHRSPAAWPGQLMFQGVPWLAAGTL